MVKFIVFGLMEFSTRVLLYMQGLICYVSVECTNNVYSIHEVFLHLDVFLATYYKLDSNTIPL